MKHRRVWVEPSESVHPLDCSPNRNDTTCDRCGCCEHCFHDCDCSECGCAGVIVREPQVVVLQDET